MREGLTPFYCTGDPSGPTLSMDWSANGYRLPTEAEWEYAARGGKAGRGTRYAGSNTAADVAWHESNNGGWLHPLGEKPPNEIGSHDMSGNVFEWCWGWYGS